MSTLWPAFSAQRVYMRMSISAQSAASTPPAPERMCTTALRWSYSPESMVCTSSESICAATSSSSSSAMEASPSSSASSYITGRSSIRERSDATLRSRACTFDSSVVTFCACAGSSQSDGSPAWSSSSRARSRRTSRSITFSMVESVELKSLIRV